MLVLGLSAHAPEAAAALVRDGCPVAAAREELFTGVRADSSFPSRAARFCLTRAACSSDDLDAVVFFVKPLRKFERELATVLQGFPATSGRFSRTMFRWLGERLWMRNAIQAELGVDPERILFAEHHQAHAAACFLGSPHEQAAVLTTGQDGEWATTALAVGRGARIEVLRELHHPHGLQRLAAAVARFLALDPVADESRLMALAGLGRPRLLEPLRSLIRVDGDGSFELCERLAKLDQPERDLAVLGELFGPPRPADEPLRTAGDDARDADLAASLRAVQGEVLLGLARTLAELAPAPALCLGGALARDPALNARLAAEGPFERVHADPAAGNAAAALGAALLVEPEAVRAHRARATGPIDWLRLGPEADDGEDRSDQGGQGGGPRAGARQPASRDELLDTVAEHLAAGRLVGWVRGRAELAGRSLGARAILADPRTPGPAARIRSGVKRREELVPFGALVAAERAGALFELGGAAAELARTGMLVARPRPAAAERLGGVLHADGSVRLRTVDRGEDPELHALLARFGDAAGEPVLLHTTLRLFGEPPVRNQAEALRVLERSQLDCLAVGARLYERTSGGA